MQSTHVCVLGSWLGILPPLHYTFTCNSRHRWCRNNNETRDSSPHTHTYTCRQAHIHVNLMIMNRWIQHPSILWRHYSSCTGFPNPCSHSRIITLFFFSLFLSSPCLFNDFYSFVLPLLFTPLSTAAQHNTNVPLLSLLIAILFVVIRCCHAILSLSTSILPRITMIHYQVSNLILYTLYMLHVKFQRERRPLWYIHRWKLAHAAHGM